MFSLILSVILLQSNLNINQDTLVEINKKPELGENLSDSIRNKNFIDVLTNDDIRKNISNENNVAKNELFFKKNTELLKSFDNPFCNYAISSIQSENIKQLNNVYINKIYYNNTKQIIEINIKNPLPLINSRLVCKNNHDTIFKLEKQNQEYLLELITVAFINKIPVDITFKTTSLFEGSPQKCCVTDSMATIYNITLKNN